MTGPCPMADSYGMWGKFHKATRERLLPYRATLSPFSCPHTLLLSFAYIVGFRIYVHSIL